MESVQLFLIEFLINKVNIQPIRAIQEEISQARTCISFQILHLPPLNIYQESPTKACACTVEESQAFQKGKSCLFALPDAVVQKPLCTFPITMSVYKEMPPGILPDVMLIGTHEIETRDLLNTLLSHQQVYGVVNPCRTMKDTYKITTATGRFVGEVAVFIRASCFGDKIVTQFQIPRNKKSHLFKGVGGAVFQCKRIDSVTPQETKCVCPPKKTVDGSGEAAATCCPSITDKRRRKERSEDVKKDKCPPCCRGTRDIVRKKESVRKCGCVVEEERFRSCTGGQI